MHTTHTHACSPEVLLSFTCTHLSFQPEFTCLWMTSGVSQISRARTGAICGKTSIYRVASKSTPCLLFIYLFLDPSLFCSIFSAPGSLFPSDSGSSSSVLFNSGGLTHFSFFFFVKGLYYQCFSAATPEQSVLAMLTNQSLI